MRMVFGDESATPDQERAKSATASSAGTSRRARLTEDELASLVGHWNPRQAARSPDDGEALDALLGAAADHLAGCPHCSDVFISPGALSDHLLQRHADSLLPLGFLTPDSHDIIPPAAAIYICPHCHYAVGGRYPAGRAVTIIIEHVAACSRKAAPASGPPPISFTVSKDRVLIDKFLAGVVRFPVHMCSIDNEVFATAEGLARHTAECCVGLKPEAIPPGILADLRAMAEKALGEARAEMARDREAEDTAAVERDEHKQDSGPRKDTAQVLTPGLSIEVTAVKRSSVGTPVEVGDCSTVMLTSEDISEGTLRLPSRIRSIADGQTDIGLILGGEKSATFGYDSLRSRLHGMSEWYDSNYLDTGDRVRIEVVNLSPPEFSVSTRWRRDIPARLMPPKDDDAWADSPLRDCIYTVLTVLGRPAHTLEIFNEVARHRTVRPGSISAVLSRYSGVLFERTGGSTWTLADSQMIGGWDIGESPGDTHAEKPPEEAVPEEVLDRIDSQDLVYRLLKGVKYPLSYEEICSHLADHLLVDAHALAAASFHNASDPRLRRMEDGRFGLSEWFEEREETKLLVTGLLTYDPNEPAVQRKSVPSHGLNPGVLFQWVLRAFRFLASIFGRRSRGQF